VKDEDEFEEARTRFAYPPSLVENARAAVGELRGMIEGFPFDQVAPARASRVAERRSEPARGAEGMRPAFDLLPSNPYTLPVTARLSEPRRTGRRFSLSGGSRPRRSTLSPRFRQAPEGRGRR